MAVHALHRGGNEGVTAKVGLAGALGACVQLGKMEDPGAGTTRTPCVCALGEPAEAPSGQRFGHVLLALYDFPCPPAYVPKGGTEPAKCRDCHDDDTSSLGVSHMEHSRVASCLLAT